MYLLWEQDPLLILNSIHFGSPQHKKTKNLLRGVVHGIGGYGNCIGVPTIAGQTSFDRIVQWKYFS